MNEICDSNLCTWIFACPVISAVFIYMNPILAQSGLSASQLGVTALVTNGLVTCARLVSGPIMDRTKRKNLVSTANHFRYLYIGSQNGILGKVL